MIRINYTALRKEEAENVQINHELLRKAKGAFGFAARKELVTLFAPHLRLLAMEIAQRQMNPQLLVEAGQKGILEALKTYDIGMSDLPFKDYATSFIKRSMQTAKTMAT